MFQKIIITVFTVFSLQALATEQPVSVEKTVPINDALVPKSGKASEEIKVVVSGLFSNGCYSYDRAEVKHVEDQVHTVSVIANVSQGMCIMALVPFTKEVNLGTLSTGNHTVRFLSGDGTYMERSVFVE